MNKTEFYEQICALSEKYENRNLETYLLALFLLVEQNREEEMTFGLLLELLSKAFISEPIIFQEEWLNCSELPNENIMSRKFTNSQLKDSIDKIAVSNTSGFDFTIEVLKFQIAELHKMRGKQLEWKEKYGGINSETGHRWYNFDPLTNLECGAACILDNAEDENETIEANWQLLGELLEDGRIYE